MTNSPHPRHRYIRERRFILLLSILLKASIDGTYVLESYADRNTLTRIPLVAGEWTRVVIYQARLPARRSFTLVGWPDGDTGPAVSFSALQILAEPIHSRQTQGFMGTMLTGGALNPNREGGR